MPASDLLLHTRLTPPRLRRRLLRREALMERLEEAWEARLTVVQAGMGYGKTTALAMLAADAPLLFWYSVEEEERDPQRFLSYLIEAFRIQLPGLSDAPLAVLHEHVAEDGRAVWMRAVDALLNALVQALPGPGLLVLDDFHFVQGTRAGAPQDDGEIERLVQRLIRYAPADLHIVLSTRHPLPDAWMARLRARGEVVEIDNSLLAFTPLQIETLFRESYSVPLAPAEVRLLAERTEGWPIALQLVWQRLRNGRSERVGDLLAQLPSSLGTLFDYLAHDVYDGQPVELAAFLTDTAVLRELTPAACDAVRGSGDSAQYLHQLHNLDLFLIATGEDHYRYHHLFHAFLRQHAWNEQATLERHRRAAAYFLQSGKHEDAIFHFVQAGDFSSAALSIEAAGEAAIRAGQLETLAAWVAALPAGEVARRPLLHAYLGDLYRLRSRFDEALAWYRQAERRWRALGDAGGTSRALRGQALVYLDTVRPADAESLLEEALRVTDGTADRVARARLLDLLAENKLNMGRPAEAEQLRLEARTWRAEGPDEDALSVRVKLRTGRLDEARRILEEWVERERGQAERGEAHSPRSHRESVLLLSLIYVFTGRVEDAIKLAQEGIDLGERLGSPFVTAVGHMRLGHALQLRAAAQWPPEPDALREAAVARYRNAISLGDRLAVRRTRLEAMWGLTRAYGFSGDLAAARRAAEEGREIGAWAGDVWVIALGDLALAASYVLAGQPEAALELLQNVLLSFRECGDQFGRAATRLWMSLAYLKLGQVERLAASLDRLFTLSEGGGYDFLFTHPTLLGPPDPRCLVPMLRHARSEPRWRSHATRLLAAMGVQDPDSHPGYQLRVQTLGGFRLWRGDVEVDSLEWKRDKARQLFQFLLTEHGQWLHREEIAERLWPEQDPGVAVRDFKVALTALNKVIEPGRIPDTPYAFIEREGAAYRLRRAADIRLDATEFELLAGKGLRVVDHDDAQGGVEPLRAAIRLYQGEYLPDSLYEDWAAGKRERLLTLFLRASDRLAEILLAQEAYQESLAICYLILARDPCWENAYRLMIRAYFAQGDRALALRAYARCAEVLARHLGVEPSATTRAVYAEVAGTGA